MFSKKIPLIVILLIGLFGTVEALEEFKKMASSKPQLIQKGEKRKWCPICGMNLKMFYKTSHTAELKDGTPRQYCSMRCLAVDTHEHNLSLDKIQVVDAKTEKLIDANKAFYLLASKIKGTMAKVSKLAFASEDDAKAFAKEYGGEIMNFKEAFAQANSSLEKDIAMIQNKKEKKIYPMGKRIFSKKCQGDLNLTAYQEINQLKSAIASDSRLCQPLKEKQLQAVSLYLWEVKRLEDKNNNLKRVAITKDEKCPVCGMFIYKYPKWAAQIFYKRGDDAHHYSFDGVKDLMKFYFNANAWGDYKNEKKENIEHIVVTDYYSQKAIDATEALYVIGSDILGPMGNELIPFSKEADAKTFLHDHHGETIVTFDKITKEDIDKLDN
jgi:nitrous oxide reductase accessory protein NosL